ncbi:telomeric repeat-binding factor 2 isoform X1 [Oryzias latipes]|uniref:Uncharacterized protein n=2 Tax=Oryzias latipes TaxID=8090 RepID=H2M8A1_ORYLA|nr:telomeric repeat-binding factor 2 isoform X1 [Oryzias latipes]
MAAKKCVNSDLVSVERVVNRWIVDYNLSLALELFKKQQFEDFNEVRNVLSVVMKRPVEATSDMPLKIRMLQFLGRINEGENLELIYDPGTPVTPLESALLLLENIMEAFGIPQQDWEDASNSLKVMIVATFIKNGNFDKAAQMLNKYFPKPVGRVRNILEGLIRQKNKTSNSFSFQLFKQEMLAFVQRLCYFDVPFSYRAAQELLTMRLEVDGDDDAEEIEQEVTNATPSPQKNPVPFQPCKHLIILRSRLESVYNALSEDEKTFAQLEQEVETEIQDRDGLHLEHSSDSETLDDLNAERADLPQRNVCSPMEASPAEQPPQTDDGPQIQARSLSKEHYTVARLVTEPDSQSSSQYTTGLEELETEAGTEKPPQVPDGSSEKELQCPVSDGETAIPTPKRPRRSKKTAARAAASVLETSSDSEDNSVEKRKEMQEETPPCQSNKSKSRNSGTSKRHSSGLQDDYITPVKRPVRQPSTGSSKKKSSSTGRSISPESVGESPITESCLDSPSGPCHQHPVPQKSSTPEQAFPNTKWKSLFRTAKESKVTWNNEEMEFLLKDTKGSNESIKSNSGHKRKWTDQETEMLKEGVKTFGEGNWSKIKSYYDFKDRTNVNLKDRWRTMKNLKMV